MPHLQVDSSLRPGASGSIRFAELGAIPDAAIESDFPSFQWFARGEIGLVEFYY
jgi:hypothetical protein